MDPWLSVVLFGAAIFGFSWMMPKRGPQEDNSGSVGEAAYDRLLEDLEMENRELVDAVAKFKDEQDQTVRRLGNRIVELERQMKVWTEQGMTSPAVQPVQPVSVVAPAVQAAAAAAATSVPEELPVLAAPAEETESEQFAAAPTSIRVRYADLIAMHDKGRSVDQIAKTAGMNKGEVQLILQLARREEEQRA